MIRALAHKGQWVLGLLLALSLFWAYQISHPRGENAAGGGKNVPIWNIPVREIVRITARDGNRKVLLRPDWEEGKKQPYVWIEASLPKREPPHKPKPKEKPVKPREVIQTSGFRGNAQAEKLIASLAKPRASRLIGSLKSLDPADFGLPSKERWVEIARNGGRPPRRMELGRNTFGNAGIYVHTPHDGAVYLMRGNMFGNLTLADQRLADHNLLSLQPREAARAELALGPTRLTLFRVAESDQWARSREASQGETKVAAVMSELRRLRVLSYPLEAPAQRTQKASALLQIRFFAKGKTTPLEELRIFPAKGDVFEARSFHTRKEVTISKTQVLSLLKKIRALADET